MNMEFKEEQRLTQWWLWLLLIMMGLLPAFGIYKQLLLGEPFGDKPMSNTGLIIFAIITFLLIAMLGLLRLKTEINQNEIRMSFFPFAKKQVNWNEIKSAEVINYGFVGGWGVRLWTKYGTVYNMKGNKGLAIELLNGEKFLIGTQREQELDKVLKRIRKN